MSFLYGIYTDINNLNCGWFPQILQSYENYQSQSGTTKDLCKFDLNDIYKLFWTADTVDWNSNISWNINDPLAGGTINIGNSLGSGNYSGSGVTSLDRQTSIMFYKFMTQRANGGALGLYDSSDISGANFSPINLTYTLNGTPESGQGNFSSLLGGKIYRDLYSGYYIPFFISINGWAASIDDAGVRASTLSGSNTPKLTAATAILKISGRPDYNFPLYTLPDVSGYTQVLNGNITFNFNKFLTG